MHGSGTRVQEPGSRPVTAMGKTAYTPLLASKRSFKRHGKSGLWVSDWYPEVAGCADDLAVLRGCHADGLNHVGSVCQMNTGSVLGGRPCLGAWSLYGLGSVNANLPGYVVLLDYPEDPPGGSRNWGTGFMPATFQGTKFRAGKTPVLDLQPAFATPDGVQRAKLDFIQELKSREIDGEIVQPAKLYMVGQRVEVARGSFSGIVGTIIEMDDRGRLVVLMNLLCRLVKVQVAARVVVPA